MLWVVLAPRPNSVAKVSIVLPVTLSTAQMDNILEELLSDPDYDQSQLQDYLKQRYGEHWKWAWQRYLETGDIV